MGDLKLFNFEVKLYYNTYSVYIKTCDDFYYTNCDKKRITSQYSKTMPDYCKEISLTYLFKKLLKTLKDCDRNPLLSRIVV